MKSWSLSTLSTFLLAFSIPCMTLAEPMARYSPGQVVVKVQLNVHFSVNNETVTSNNANLSAVLAEIQARNVHEVFPFDRQGSQMSRFYILTIPSDADVIQTVTKLSKLECVHSAQPNYVYTCSATPTDISYIEQWGLQKINASTAWDFFTGSDQVVIAVLDTGVDWEHQDLAANIWNNPGEIANNGIDDDVNNYVDDVRGWDFAAYQYSVGFIDPEDPEKTITNYFWKPEDNDPGMDRDSEEYQLFGFHPHGTHVAGIAGAVGNNTVEGTTNIVGTLWNCKIMPIKAAYSTGYFESTWVAKGVRYAADNGAQVINMSFGGFGSSGIEDIALQYAHKKGVVLCAAAGNEYTIRAAYPASFNNVISVAATDENDRKADFSNYGETVDISAPGTDILSTVPENGYRLGGGTSMASPFVSGAAAMILGYGEVLGKKFSPGQVEYILEQSADSIAADNPGYETWLGAGRLNLGNALVVAQTAPPMISSMLIQSVASPDDDPVVTEHSSLDLQALAFYTNGETEDITDKVTWTVRPIQYGRFSSYDAGKFIALQVPDDREVVVTATYKTNGYSLHGQRVVTIKNNLATSPLSVTGPDEINPLSSELYRAVYTDAEGQSVDVTAKVTWAVISGTEYANFDTGQAGLLLTRISAAGKLLTIQATYVDETSRRAFMKSYNIQVRAVSEQVAGLFLTAPATVAAGSPLELKASLILAGQAQSKDVTALSTWSASPAGAGTFTEPGLFQAGNVGSETTVTLKVEYTTDGKVYTAQLNTKIIPAVPMSEITIRNDADDTEQKNTQTESNNISEFFQNLAICPVAGFLVLITLMGGVISIREN